MPTLNDRVREAQQLVEKSMEAADADSNDYEIGALQDARDALNALVGTVMAGITNASKLTIGVWVSDLDGVPVVQIDMPDDTARFRVNVNDAPIWDRTSGEPSDAGMLVCAECGTHDAGTYVVTVLDQADPTTRTEVCEYCHRLLNV